MLIYYEGSLNEMGIPAWVARDPEREWLPDETIDQPVARLEQYRAELKKGGGQSAPGLRILIREKTGRPPRDVPVDAQGPDAGGDAPYDGE